MGISHFATDQTKIELEKGKHFLKVPCCNLQVYLFLGLIVPHTKKNQQYNTIECKTLLFVTTPSPLLPQQVQYSAEQAGKCRTNLLQTKPRLILVSDIQKKLNLCTLPCI